MLWLMAFAAFWTLVLILFSKRPTQSFHIRKEYERLGLLTNGAFTEIEQTICPTYPNRVIVPYGFDIDAIFTGSQHRSIRRFPVITWISGSGVAISRCSQPLVGLFGRGNAVDDQLVERLAEEIFDCRSFWAAFGNRLMGKGTEAGAQHLNIGNIHKVRSSLQTEHDWRLEMQAVTRGSHKVATSILNGKSVLVHCSDGWDRTSQVVSLAQLILDPYYRTMEGFADLVEKDWCQFGHQFALRNQVGSHEQSPIFLLWLECVYQLVQSNPTAFEFSADYLIYLATWYHTGRYRNFLGNTATERSTIRNYRCIWSDLGRMGFNNAFFESTQAVLFVPLTLEGHTLTFG